METNISDFPDELIERIMSFMGFEERKAARMVCKRWQRISYGARLIGNDCTKVKSWNHLDKMSPMSRHVNLTVGGFCPIKDASSGISPFWKRHGQDIKSLHLYPIECVYPELSQILNCCPKLESIILRGNPKISGLSNVVANVPVVALSKLEHLELHRIDHMHRNAFDLIEALFSKLPQLKKLIVISGVPPQALHIDQDKIARLILSLVKAAAGTLKELDLSHINIKCDMFRDIATIVGPNLTRLMIGHSITDVKLYAIAENCVQLQQFSTHASVSVYHTNPTSPSIQRLLDCLRRATHVSLSGLNLKYVQLPAAINRVDTLVALDLSYTRIRAENLIAAFSEPHTKLEKFIMHGPSCINGGVLQQICPNMPNLLYLSFNSRRIENSSLLSICKFNEKLKFLSIEKYGRVRCEGPIDVSALNALTGLIVLNFDFKISGLTSLSLLNLRDIYLRSTICNEAEVKSLIEKCPLLEMLHLYGKTDDRSRDVLESRKRASNSKKRYFLFDIFA